MLHRLGFTTTPLLYVSRDVEDDPKKGSPEYIKVYVKNRDVENGMIRLARHLLRMSKKFRCGGYDIGIDVDSDDDQVYGYSDAHLW